MQTDLGWCVECYKLGMENGADVVYDGRTLCEDHLNQRGIECQE